MSRVGGKIVTSTIGAPTPARLYGFDLKGLLQHDSKVSSGARCAEMSKTKDSKMISSFSVRSDAEGARGRLSEPEHIVTVEQGLLPWCVRVSGMSASYSVSSGSGG